MEILIAMGFTGIGLFVGIFFIWKNHRSETVSQANLSKSK